MSVPRFRGAFPVVGPIFTPVLHAARETLPALIYHVGKARKTAGFPTGKAEPMGIRKLLARVDIDMVVMVTLSAVLAVMTCAVIGAILGAL